MKTPRTMSSIMSILLCIAAFAAPAKSGTYLNPSSGFFLAPLSIQDSSTPHGLLRSVLYDIPDIFKCLPRFLAGKISSGTESAVLSMTQPVNYIANEKLTEEYFLKCMSGAGVGDSDAAEVFMRKLGNKILKEKDWRVAGKSLFIMHQMLTSPAISIDIVRELAESYLERFSIFHNAIQNRMNLRDGDRHALLWVQQYLEYIRSLSEVVRRRSGDREVQDFRSLLRLSSGYCLSAAQLLDVSLVASATDGSILSASSRAFFIQLSGSCNALVRSDIRAHSGSLASLQTSSSTICAFQQESLSEIQRHAKDIREAVTHVLESSVALEKGLGFRSPSDSSTIDKNVRPSGSAKSNSKFDDVTESEFLKNCEIDLHVIRGKVCWLESLAEMQCDVHRLVTPATIVAPSQNHRGARCKDSPSNYSTRTTNRRRTRFSALV